MTPSTVSQPFSNAVAAAGQGDDAVVQGTVEFAGGDALLGFSGSAWSQQPGQISLQVYVDGKKVADPVNYKMQRHDTIVVAYGQPGSFPTSIPANFPNGL